MIALLVRLSRPALARDVALALLLLFAWCASLALDPWRIVP